MTKKVVVVVVVAVDTVVDQYPTCAVCYRSHCWLWWRCCCSAHDLRRCQAHAPPVPCSSAGSFWQEAVAAMAAVPGVTCDQTQPIDSVAYAVAVGFAFLTENSSRNILLHLFQLCLL